MKDRIKTDYAPEELVDLMADWMIEHGPDGHCDGHNIIAQKAWDWCLKNQNKGLREAAESLDDIIREKNRRTDATICGDKGCMSEVCRAFAKLRKEIGRV